MSMPCPRGSASERWSERVLLLSPISGSSRPLSCTILHTAPKRCIDNVFIFSKLAKLKMVTFVHLLARTFLRAKVCLRRGSASARDNFQEDLWLTAKDRDMRSS